MERIHSEERGLLQEVTHTLALIAGHMSLGMGQSYSGIAALPSVSVTDHKPFPHKRRVAFGSSGDSSQIEKGAALLQ